MGKRLFLTYREKRPVLITLICIVGVIFNLMSVFGLLFLKELTEELAGAFGTHFVMIALITSISTIIAYIGLWRMRMWGIMLYGVSAIVFSAATINSANPQWTSYALSMIVLIICLLNLRKMKQ